MRKPRPIVPASLFSVVLGVVGIGSAWRVAARVWGSPGSRWLPGGAIEPIAEAIMAVGSLVWLVLFFCFIRKWLFARSRAVAELRDPIQGGYVSLVPVSTMLVALALAPYVRIAALVLFVSGVAGQLLFGASFIAGFLRGGRDGAIVTPVLYLPGVASNFVTAIVAASLGFERTAALFFGAGIFYWVAAESVIVQAIAMQGSLSRAGRPSLGILLAPPAVGCVAYLSITSGPPDVFAEMLYGYAALYTLVLARLGPWIWKPSGFSAAYWAFAFGGTAISTAGLRFVERGNNGLVAWLAAPMFVAANLLVAGLSLGTLVLMFRGKLVPSAAHHAGAASARASVDAQLA